MAETVFAYLKYALVWGTSQEVTGVLQWVGTVIAIVGIPLAVFKSSKAASAARLAERAVRSFSTKLSLANVAHSYSQVEIVRNLVASNNYIAAMSVVGILKRTVLQIATELETGSDALGSIRQGKRNIAIVQTQINLAMRRDSKFNQAALDGAIIGLGDVLLAWEAKFFENRSGAI